MILNNYLLISLRNLYKNKVFVGINVFGMAIAIACSLIAYLSFMNHAGYDRMHADVATVYRVSSVRDVAGSDRQDAALPVPLGRLIQENVGDVKAVVRYSPSYSEFMVNDAAFDASLAYVDPSLFDVFTFEFTAGKPLGGDNRAAIVLSERMSRKLFGTTEAVGKTVQQRIASGDVYDYAVAGIFKDPVVNNSFMLDAYVIYDHYFREFPSTTDHWTSYNNIFVKLEHADRTEAVTKQLQAYCSVSSRPGSKVQIKRFYLEPFTDMARRDSEGDTFGTLTGGATPAPIIITLVLMSLLILAIACFNLTNTLVAISTRRLKEIGLRKVMGSIRLQLIVQFIGESVLICLFAVLLGLAFTDVLLLAWNAMWPFLKLELAILQHTHIIIFLVCLALLTGGLSGIYPAFYISRFEAAHILKGKVDFGGTSYFTRLLLAGQFTFSVLALFFSVAFYQNSVYQKNFDPGFAHNDVLVVPVKDAAEYAVLRNGLVHQPDVVSVTGSVNNLFSNRQHEPVTINGLDIESDILAVGEGYCKTMGLDLLEGRDFNAASENDRRGSVIITEGLAASAGLAKSLDQTIVLHDTLKVFVIGVIRDVYTYGTWHARQPMVLRYTPEASYQKLIVRVVPGRSAAVEQTLHKVWARQHPNKPYAGTSMNALMNVTEDISRNVVTIFTFLATVALLLSIAGLYSTVSLNLSRRMKEVGVRKIFGASVRQIIWVTNIQFVVILLISAAIGCIVGGSLVGFTMRLLWTYYQDANVFTFVAATGIVVVLACVMIGTKVYRAAMANPVISLREE